MTSDSSEGSTEISVYERYCEVLEKIDLEVSMALGDLTIPGVEYVNC